LRCLKIEKFFDLKLTEQEMKTIFDALLERPFRDVYQLIQKLQEIYKNGNSTNPNP
jgi:hypothetical protein